MPSFEQLNGELSPLDLSYTTYNNFTSSPMEEYNNQTSSIYEPYMATPEEQPPFSAALSMPPVDWSAFDLNNGTLDTVYSQPPSYASFDQGNIGRPGLTTSSSEELSESEDLLTQGLPSPGIVAPPHYPRSSSSEQVHTRPYGLSDASSSYVGLPQISKLAHTSIESITPETFLPGGTASPSEFEEFRLGTKADPEAFTRHGFTVQDAQKLAHPSVPTEAMGELSLPATRDDNDPLWAATFDVDEPGFDGVDDTPATDWIS